MAGRLTAGRPGSDVGMHRRPGGIVPVAGHVHLVEDDDPPRCTPGSRVRFRGPHRTCRAGVSEKAAVKKAKATRLSLKDVPVRRIAAEAETTKIATLYTGGDGVYLQYRDGLTCTGPTGAGKTWRVCWKGVTDAVGPVVATSTRGDLLRSTWAERSEVGRVEVFDPEGLTAIANPMRWSILDGCDDPEVAKRRAEALVQAMPMDDTSNAGYWNGKAAMLMRGYLYTAAVKNKDLMDLRIWASSRNVKLVRDVLKRDLPDWHAELGQALDSKSDSSDDVVSACARLLEPLASPKLMGAINVPRSESADLHALMTEGKNTVYLVSEGHSASAAAFTTVLSAELYHVAKTHGLTRPDDKIDPPLRMVLDEMNNVAAIPNMPDLITDSGGRGIQIWALVHSALQNEKRWGRIGGQRLSTDSPARMYLPGLGDESELAALSRLMGSRDEYTSHDPRSAPRSVPVMALNEIREMPEDQALMMFRNAKPMKVRLPSVWDVPDLSKRVRANQAAFDDFCTKGSR
ncbi:hypothetical protein CBI33_28075 [Rhodococcus erythropolis]|nr:hypothetical protein CBI33_28075 [Rhodococcus erythropolis]